MLWMYLALLLNFSLSTKLISGTPDFGISLRKISGVKGEISRTSSDTLVAGAEEELRPLDAIDEGTAIDVGIGARVSEIEAAIEDVDIKRFA
ncbi:hypothetical protein TNIN_352231 [Trichonephila inaurata madagascariensis]|uniref:Uncharacterized protein n=1 Tax=Trichonephila inaurata madagascariensis TaxID=2747483 RepID=A0A8X7BP27_9ARAC|nr:hypothetical protein TNIN_352231 [Trichonephila inaurata madagascariensis]